MFLGNFIIGIGFVLIPLVFGIFGFIFSKEKKLRQAIFSLIISLVIMLLSFWITNTLVQIQVKKDTEAGIQARQEADKNRDFPISQESQYLPPLDNRRAITIANQLTNSNIVTIRSPFTVRAYVRDDAVPSGGEMQASVSGYIPESRSGLTDFKEFATGKLFPTQNRSADGRMIFEGTILLKDVFGATSGYLYVIGKDGVKDGIEITFKQF
ncbi:hypothetical protein A3A03_01915 [Candidatus Nomurabacteria bacterium RIFCSPLOWO2_01_FULL_40_18]|uniref:Uncharacterized protein n=1 Tax=Candidatus Nomurabacteria bacterium RIFCSPLOWO2_01_FULL_40_18 TaxID=1801773 RepID=A0A1F6XI74_9BACT|nr:MAG: hypothetical protein A3A03_01915 [Candidatus Nomurabacteria bacterium RIFCSPLOWO2_01_FULL_40_18]